MIATTSAKHRSLARVLAVATLALAGCTTGPGTNPEPDAEPDTGPAYLVGTRVWDDTTTTSYFHVVPSLEAGTEIDSSQALEIPGAAKLYALGDIGWFAVGGDESPTITRYTLSDDGALEEQETLSLAAYGVDGLWDTLYLVSETKAYYPDRAGQQLVVINPTAMTVEGAIDLPETAREGYLSLYSYDAVVEGDKLLFSVGWFDWETNDAVLGETGLVVIDTTTDTVERMDVDTRCGGVTSPLTMASGDTYFVSSALAGAAYRLERATTEPCALRIEAGADAFDPSFAQALDELTGGALAGEPVPGGDGKLFLRVFDEEAATIEEGAYTWDLTGQTVWEWWSWDVESGQAARVEALEPSTADVFWFEVDGRVFGTETNADYTETTLIDLNAEGGPAAALVAPGFLHGVARVR